MSGDPVRAALETACRQDAFYGPGKGPSGYDEGLRGEYAQIIAAFLRALPNLNVCTRNVCKYNGTSIGDAADLAAAVEAAAKGEK